MEFFLKPENVNIWSRVQEIAANDDDEGIRKYVLEAQRLTTRGRNMRIATTSTKIGERSITPGSAVVLMLVSILHFPSSLMDILTRRCAGRGRARRQSCAKSQRVPARSQRPKRQKLANGTLQRRNSSLFWQRNCTHLCVWHGQACGWSEGSQASSWSFRPD